MPDAAPQKNEIYAPREITLGGELLSYITALARQAPGTIIFRTGAGRLFRDLLVHWPTLKNYENEAQELCQRISEASYPLAGELYAQAVEVAVTISPKAIASPAQIDALSTCVVFDIEKKVERVCFLSPHKPLPPASLLGAPKGVAVLCRPLNYRYHTLKDDRKRTGHPHAGFYELSQRLINQLYELPTFVPRDHVVLETLKTKVSEMAKPAEQPPAPRPAPAVSAPSGLSALPAPVRSLERSLLTYATDKTLSPDMRLGLRQLAQNVRALYPQAIIEEAARYETLHPAPPAPAAVAPPAQNLQMRPVAPPPVMPAPRPLPQAFPRATPVANVGKLAQTPNLQRGQMPLRQHAKPGKATLWPAPSPYPYPSFTKTK